MPTSQDPNTLAWALGTLSTITTAMIGFIGYERRAKNKQLEENTKRIATLESQMVNETRVRELLNEGLVPVLLGLTNIEKLLSQNTQSLTALDTKYEIDKARREERELILSQLEERKHG